MSDKEEQSTLAVSRDVAQRVKVEASKARLSMYQYTNLALQYVMDHTDITTSILERTRK